MTTCVTRLLVTGTEAAWEKDDAYFKGVGTHGISKNGKAMQVIVGMTVPSVREKFENILANPSAYVLDMGQTEEPKDAPEKAENAVDAASLTEH